MKTLIVLTWLSLVLFFAHFANAQDLNPCRAISGTVDRVRGTTATLILPEGGTARVSTLCLPEGATEGTVIVRGAIDQRATRIEKARPSRVRRTILRLRSLPVSLGWNP